MSATKSEIRIHPGYQFGAPCIQNTRVPTSSLAGCVMAGDSVDAVADGYELTRDDVLLACWYEEVLIEQVAPSRRTAHERRVVAAWHSWADLAFRVLAGWLEDELPDPPKVR